MENNNDAFDFNSWADSVLNQGENKSNNFSVDSLLNDATKLPVSYYGAYNTSDYKKYLGSSAVEEVGINPGWSNRDFEVKFDEAQPYSEAVANTLSKFVDITKDATVNYFKSYYTGADDLIAYNQKKAQEDSDKGFSDPTFTSSTKSGLGSVFSTDFYENLFPSLGYVVGTMGSAVLENIAIDLLTGGLGAGAELLNSGRKVKNTINYLLNVDKIKGALKAEQALTGMQKFKAGAQMYNMINGVRSEAAMEGGNNAFETLEKQKKDFKDKYGYEAFGEDLERMENYAKSAGKADYYLNLPILMASNLVQFSDLLIPEVVRASAALEDTWKGYNLVNKGTALAPQLELEQKTFSSLWESAKGFDKVKAVAQYTSEIPAFKYLTSAGSEGMEESLQKMASTFSQDYYLNKSKGTEDVWDSTKHGLGQMFNDEGVQEFLGGFMIGSLSHARHGAVDVVNKTKDLFTKKEDRPVRLSEKDIEFNKMKEKVNYLNDTSLDKVLKADGIKDAFVNGQLSREMKAFSKNGDIFNLKNSQDHALLNYLWAGYKTGKLDYRLNELEKIANLDYSKDEMAAMLGVSVNELNDKRGSQAVRNIIDKVKANKVNFQAVEDYFEKNSSVGELRNQYNNDSNEFNSLVNSYANKYKATNFEDVVSKLTKKETNDLLIRQVKLEESKANLIAYNEGVKVAAFSYATLQNDKARQMNIFNTLANSSKLDYTAARELMNVTAAQERKKQLVEAIKTAKAINDPQVKNYEKQLELVNNVIEEHGKDQFMSPNKMAKLLQDFAHESLPETERVKISKDARMMDDLNPLSDVVKLEKKNRRNVELYDYLMDIKNFSNYNRKISKDILNFRRKTLDWFADMQEQQKKAATATATTTTTTTTTTATTPTNAKFKKGDRVSYNDTVYSILDTVDVGNGKFAYSLVDSAGEPLLDEKDLKVYAEESELQPVITTPSPAPAPVSTSTLTGEEKEKEDAINEFIKNNPIYKKEEIEFVTEKDANGKTTNKVISKNPTNKGENLSNKPEFKDLINKLNDTQEQREEERRKDEELKAKIKEFNSEKVKYINGKKKFTKEEIRNLKLDIKDFMEANGLDPRKVTGTLKELLESILSIVPIDVKEEKEEENDYVPGVFKEGAVTTNPFKTTGQEEETITLPTGERQGTGKILDDHLEGTYNHFVQSSLGNVNFLDG
jgi:arsenate reductase-like glutaredoxin family protein